MGISADDTIVVYDGPGMFSAPRVWWMFRVMGVFQVYVLDGGFDRWKADGRPVTSEQTKIAPNVFHVDFDASRVASLDDMKKIVATGESQIADARPAGAVRRRGAGAAGWRARRPYAGREKPAGIDAVEGRQAAAARRTGEALRGAGIDLSKPVVTSCGSGITAAVITLALETLGPLRQPALRRLMDANGAGVPTRLSRQARNEDERGRKPADRSRSR